MKRTREAFVRLLDLVTAISDTVIASNYDWDRMAA
jgi:hypothetical protein